MAIYIQRDLLAKWKAGLMGESIRSDWLVVAIAAVGMVYADGSRDACVGHVIRGGGAGTCRARP